jgi:hypothetical protein
MRAQWMRAMVHESCEDESLEDKLAFQRQALDGLMPYLDDTHQCAKLEKERRLQKIALLELEISAKKSRELEMVEEPSLEDFLDVISGIAMPQKIGERSV